MSGTFTAPKVWTLEEVLEYDDLNALAAEIADRVNGILNAQIAGDAGIEGTKIASAPNGLVSAKFANSSVTGSKMAVSAATEGEDHTISVSPVTLDATYQDLASVTRTMSDGRAFVLGIAAYDVAIGAAAGSGTFRLDKGGSPLGSSMVAGPIDGQATEVKGGVVVIPYIEAPGSGSTTWKMQATKGVYTGTWVVRSCQLWVWEWY